ncbi:4272_t:CDS:2, partial [Racocetra persica]
NIVSPSWIRLFADYGTNLLISIPGIYLSGRSTYVVLKHLKCFKNSNASHRSRDPVSTNASYKSKDPILENQVQVEYPPIKFLDPSYRQRSDDLLSIIDLYRQINYPITDLDPSNQRSNEELSNVLNNIENNSVYQPQDALLTLPPRPHTSRLIVMPPSSTGLSGTCLSYNMTKIAALRMVLFTSFFALINIFASISAVIDIVNNHPIPTEVIITDWVEGLQGIIMFLVFGLPKYQKHQSMSITMTTS